MRCSLPLVGWVIAFCLFPPAQAQAPPFSQADTSVNPPWSLSGSLGEGQLKLESDQQQGDRIPTFALGFAASHSLGDRVRAGLQLSGWLLQAFGASNPATGESVSSVMGAFDVFLFRHRPLFALAGMGYGFYTNNQPTGIDDGGLAWEAGGGYEFPVSRSVRLAPIIDYSGGSLGKAGNSASQTNSRYSVIEFKLTILYRIGH